MDMMFYIILGVTIVSYLLGLFLSYFEKKGRMSVLSSMGNVGFINIYGINTPTPEELHKNEVAEKNCALNLDSIKDDEII